MKAMRRGWFHLATGAGIGRVLGFSSNLLLSRWLGPTELGLFNLVTTTVQTSETLVRVGGDYALNFELGGQPEATKSDRGAELARALVQLCSLTTVLICVAVAIWIWCGHGLFPSSFVASKRVILTGLLLLMIAAEGTSASAWEVLLVSQRTASLAMRQGLFFPLRLLFSAGGALFAGLLGAMGGWSFIAFVQSVWLRRILGSLWNPLHIWPLLNVGLRQLLIRGFPFYASNLLASIIFYPLLLKVANTSGLAEIGYLRVGQILQQLFAFLPATFVPVLFLRLRGEPNFSEQVLAIEKSFRLIWLLLLEVLLLYCVIDKSLILWLFGAGFSSALMPTRLLLITALCECLAQLVVQPLLAAGHTRIYGLYQNGAALLAAALGWLWIPSAGLPAYLIARLLYVVVPLIGCGIPVFKQFYEPEKILSLTLVTFGSIVLFSLQTFYEKLFVLTPLVSLIAFLTIFLAQRQDLLMLKQALRRT